MSDPKRRIEQVIQPSVRGRIPSGNLTPDRDAMRTPPASGVTLIELMIVVVIIGILAAISYPSYRNYMTQTRRSDAQIALTQAANRQEKFFSDCNWYAATVPGTRACGTNTTGVLGISNTSPEGHYTLSPAAGVIAPGASGCTAYTCGYTLIATPVVGGLQANDGKFRIDSTSVKQWDKANNNSYSSRWTDK